MCNLCYFLHPSNPVQGLLSSLMREQANISHLGPKWIVLDGDIDPMWTESLNTVMDDNKVPPSCSLIHYSGTHSNQGDIYRKSCFCSPPTPIISWSVSTCGSFFRAMIHCQSYLKFFRFEILQNRFIFSNEICRCFLLCVYGSVNLRV